MSKLMQDKLTISFWIWAIFDVETNPYYDDLERRFPGVRFRVINELDELRPNIKVFVNRERITDLGASVGHNDEVFIMQALSGG